jgi:hypothetical protein
MIDVSVRRASEEIPFNMNAAAALCARILGRFNVQFTFDEHFNLIVTSRFFEHTADDMDCKPSLFTRDSRFRRVLEISGVDGVGVAIV